MNVRHSDELVHSLSHMNEEKRAGRTWCGQYIEFWPDHLKDLPVTCLECIAQPELSPEEWRKAKRDVDERGDDWAMRRKNHLEKITGDGRCAFCGYSHKMRFYT
jgi:hypothetical protein